MSSDMPQAFNLHPVSIIVCGDRTPVGKEFLRRAKEQQESYILIDVRPWLYNPAHSEGPKPWKISHSENSDSLNCQLSLLHQEGFGACVNALRSRICSVSLPEFVPEIVLSHHTLAGCIDCRSNRNCLEKLETIRESYRDFQDRVPQMWDRMRDANSCLAWIFWKNFLREWGTAKNRKNTLLFKCHASGVTPKQICLSVMPAAPPWAPLA